ncbi:hypothetical protein B1B04_13160 [Lysinibacillus sp. KCTC 33748]|uniref:helix-turn-helix domain-containing protein n=1 Tax=unclassified Lysinibacillus TaxID=2636778 RepID=UPI0009A75F9C|nr:MULTISPECIES: helix-turn-helix transcriptional regulator [unclassified Lysinibacillus]OXS73228.1 hypothetical protein B1B04_13160 [Lysinibacillus sp. KCTC 33748]SKB82989.1 hypothetical protein SAMN06295926_10988 [Lysinibacillus sp. AC-3]
MKTYKERCQLLMEMRLKKIKAKDLAELLGCSKSWISQYFNNKVDIPKESEDKIVAYVESK